eukprot:XP_001709923.1 Hypothetical protein GL50803_37869 [Giardia lamblia ATCC 50803]
MHGPHADDCLGTDKIQGLLQLLDARPRGRAVRNVNRIDLDASLFADVRNILLLLPQMQVANQHNLSRPDLVDDSRESRRAIVEAVGEDY